MRRARAPRSRLASAPRGRGCSCHLRTSRAPPAPPREPGSVPTRAPRQPARPLLSAPARAEGPRAPGHRDMTGVNRMAARPKRAARLLVTDTVPPTYRSELIGFLRARMRASLAILLVAGALFTAGDVLYHHDALGP